MSFTISASGTHAQVTETVSSYSFDDALGQAVQQLLMSALEHTTGNDPVENKPLKFDVSASGHSDQVAFNLNIVARFGHFAGHDQPAQAPA